MQSIAQEFLDFFDLATASAPQRERTRVAFSGLLTGSWPGKPAVAQLAAELWQLMSAPDRRYHSAVHVLSILGRAQRLGVTPTDADFLAVLFHDAIYDPRASDGSNEAASAELLLARAIPLGLPMATCQLAAESIRWTGRHGEPSPPARHALVLDLDLIGLASDPEAFRRQSVAVEREMAHLEPGDFRRGQLKLFTRLLDRTAIFHTAAFAGLEATARANVQAETLRLRALA